jgi:1-acyl-sn-glycerol-3-phosphate acyltransferase
MKKAIQGRFMRFLRRVRALFIASVLMFIYVCLIIVIGIPFLLIAGLKALIPFPAAKNAIYRCMEYLWEFYVSLLYPITSYFLKTEWVIQGAENLEANAWYVVISNHVSAVDIMVVQSVFNRKIPILKFFIKEELKQLPIIGWSCVAMDFPFMKRPSKAEIAKNPELKNVDLETTRKACEQFKDTPTSIINFVEGTRFTMKKQLKQQSPYKHLLKPHAGGIALALSILGKQAKAMLDVTLVYEGGNRFKDFLLGRIKRIIVKIEILPIADTLHGDYANDAEYRKQFRNWMNHRWELKDAWLNSRKTHH